MEGRGQRTRGRPSSAASNKKEPAMRANKSAAEQQKESAPVKRSSRSRSTAKPVPAAAATPLATTRTTAKRTVGAVPSPIKEKDEDSSSPTTTTRSTPTTRAKLSGSRGEGGGSSTPTSKLSSPRTVKSQSSATFTTTTSGYSSTRETIEIRTEGISRDGSDFSSNLANYLRRSVSKTISLAGEALRERSNTPTNTNTELEGSRYSRSVSRSIYEDDDYSKVGEIEEQDEDDEDVVQNEHFKSFSIAQQQQINKDDKVLSCKLQAPREFGGFWGILLLLLLVPTLVYYLQYTCGKPGCTFRALNITQVLDVASWSKHVFKPDAVVAYFLFNWTILLLSIILFGWRIRVPSAERSLNVLEYKFNLLPMAVLLTLTAAVAEYLKYPVANFVTKHYLRFLVYGCVNAFVLALWSHISALSIKQQRFDANAQINSYGRTGNALIDFALGRHINPKWLNLVCSKQVHYRVSILATLLFAECFIYKNLKWPNMPTSADEITLYALVRYFWKFVRFDGSTLLAATLLLLYVMDAIIFEHHLTSSFELNGEGFGCLLLLRYAVTPYLLGAVSKYFFDRRIPLTCKWAIWISFLLLISGLLLKRWSNALKYKYRINPLHAQFNAVETIATYQGRRLLLGPIWGRLRQPNYLGDILALLGLATPIFLRFVWPPVVSVLLLIILLIHRALRVNARNTSRYHSSWVRYRCRVRNYLLPHIF